VRWVLPGWPAPENLGGDLQAVSSTNRCAAPRINLSKEQNEHYLNPRDRLGPTQGRIAQKNECKIERAQGREPVRTEFLFVFHTVRDIYIDVHGSDAEVSEASP